MAHFWYVVQICVDGKWIDFMDDEEESVADKFTQELCLTHGIDNVRYTLSLERCQYK